MHVATANTKAYLNILEQVRAAHEAKAIFFYYFYFFPLFL